MSNLHFSSPDHDPIGGTDSRVVGNVTGLLKKVKFHLPQRHEPELYHSYGEFGDVERLIDVPSVQMNAAGEGTTQRGSAIRCIGETVERYCAHWPSEYHAYDTTTTSYTELSDATGGRTVPLEFLQLFGEQTFRTSDDLVPLESDSEVRWAEATDLLTGEETYVPQSLLVPPSDELPEAFLTPVANSNGIACHRTLEKATLNGLLELVERNAIMTHWYRATPPRQLTNVTRLPEAKRLLDEHIGTRDFEYRLLYYPTDLDVHTVSCAYINRKDEKPKFGIVGASAIDFADAVEDALVECAQVMVHGKDTLYHLNRPDLQEADLTDHYRTGLYYMQPENFGQVEPFVSGPEMDVEEVEQRSHPYETTAERLDHVLDELEIVGYSPAGVEITTGDMREAGFRVAATYVPELVPLSVAAYPPVNHPAFDGYDTVQKPHPLP